MVSVVGLALADSVMFAVAAAVEQRGALRAVAAPHHRHVPALLAALHASLWWAGAAADAAGFALHATALHSGSLGLVQPLMVTVLLFTLPLAAAGTPVRVSLRDWVGQAPPPRPADSPPG